MCVCVGYGVGAYLGGLFKRVLPLVKKNSVAVGKEILNSGSKIMNDIENNVTPRDAITARTNESLQNLARKTMFGNGYIAGKFPRKRQLSSGVQRVSIKKRRKIVKKKQKVVKKIVKKKKNKIVKRKNKSKGRKISDIFAK